LKQKDLNKSLKKIIFTALIVLFIDQFTKLIVKTSMHLHENFSFFQEYFNLPWDWFIIYFIENEGMAYGMELPGSYGKLVLTLVRISVVIFGFMYIRKFIKKNNYPIGLLICFGLIMGGAIGNIIDSIFYGVIFNEAPLFYGSVVDMLHFPLFEVNLPNWLSFLEGNDDNFLFFAPVFNIADSAVFIGITAIVFSPYRKYFV